MERQTQFVHNTPETQEMSPSAEGPMLTPPAFQLQASPDNPPSNDVAQRQVAESVAQPVVQRSTDYDALAQRIKTELNEYFPDTEDIVAVFKQLPPGGLQQLMNAYNLISPSKPLVMHLKEELGDDAYMHVMDAATSISIAETTKDDTFLAGNTTESAYNLRASASTDGAIIGKLNFSSMPVQVVGKGISGDITWNKIKFKNATDYAAVTAGHTAPTSAADIISKQEAWVTSDAIASYVPWNVFMSQLNAFDVFTYDLDIKEKVTLLRQMAHPSDLPFDAVIGTDSGDFYEDDRDNHHAFFQLLMDGKAIQTPNGEIIDIYHFIVGLDAYQSTRRQNKASPNWGNSDVGKSDAAATWSGDLGAAAADCLLETSSEMEGHLDSQAASGSASETDRINYYYRSRAPEADLLADIDAWAAYQEVENGTALTVTEVVNNYYGVQRHGGTAFKAKRKDAFTKFMARYGLSTTGGTVMNTANLVILQTQIEKFGVSWIQNRKKAIWPSYNEVAFRGYCRSMAYRFLQFIEKHGKANGAF